MLSKHSVSSSDKWILSRADTKAKGCDEAQSPFAGVYNRFVAQSAF